ncbi:serine/threonine protein kinase [bacterium]|nr:serine/threonine protein kinase [bacterium]MBP9809111.1 serine/threonine protein kinase [bacterium]
MKPVRHKEAKSEQAKLVVDDLPLASDPSPESVESSLEESKGEKPDPDIGRIIAQQYQLLERIGEGGMSTVYRAKHLALEKEVAVKLLAQPRTKDPTILKRFKQEAVAISKLDHSNIVRLRDYGIDNQGEPYLVMDLVVGQSLAQLLEAKHKFSLQDSFSIVSQTLSALAHAHSQEIVHRDIKPSNIMISFDTAGKPIVQVVDFGIAKLNVVNDTSVLTRTGDMFGSPHYMSPEQCLGDPVDCRSDLYSLGCLLYELLEGHPPYQADNLLRVLHMHISDKPPKLSENPSAKLPANLLDGFVAKAMAREQANRYASAEAMQSDINILLHGNSSSLSFRKGEIEKNTKTQENIALNAKLGTYIVAGLIAVFTCCALMLSYLNQGQNPQTQLQSLGRIAATPANLVQKPIRVNDIRFTDRVSNQTMGTTLRHDGQILPSLHAIIAPGSLTGTRLIAPNVSDEFLWSAIPAITPSYRDRVQFLDQAVKNIEGKPLASVLPDEIIYYARHLQQSGDINRALNLYDQLLEHPNLDTTKRAEVNNWRGDCFMDMGLLAQAEQCYREAAPILANSKEHKIDRAILDLKHAYCMAGPHNGLVLEVHSALSNSTVAFPQGGSGNVAKAKELKAKAIKQLSELAKEQDTKANSRASLPAHITTKLYAALGSALLADGRYAEAVAAYEKADNNFAQQTKRNSAFLLDHYILRANLAMALAKSGQVDKAIDITNNIIKIMNTQNKHHTPSSLAGAILAPTIRNEILPRLHYSLACFYELKLKANGNSQKDSNSSANTVLKQRVMSNLSTALALAEPTYHDTQFKGVIWEKIAHFNKQFDPSNTAALEQANKEINDIFTDRQLVKSIRPMVICEDEAGF